MITHISLPTPPQRKSLWSWLRGAMRLLDLGSDGRDLQRADAIQAPSAQAAGVMELRTKAPKLEENGPTHGDVLPFPIHGEALLVRLAEVLRGRLADRGPAHNPLSLTISRCPGSRLSIDGVAYVDYLSELSTYRAAIEAAPDTKVILETTDFDALVSFIMQYLNDRLSEPASAEIVP